MFLKPQYFSWEPSSSFTAMVGQLHCRQYLQQRQNFPIHSSQNIFIGNEMPHELADSWGRSGPSFQYYTKEKKGNLLGSLRRSLGLVRMCRDTKAEFFKHNALGASFFLSPRASLNAVSCCNIWLGSSRAMSDTGLYSLRQKLSLYNLCATTSWFSQTSLCSL